MATLATTKLHIPGKGHVFTAPADTDLFDIKAFDFTKPTTWGTWTWMGDTAQDTPVEFETDGGEPEFKGTWDRPGIRSIRSDKTLTGTLNSNNVSAETFTLAFPDSTTTAGKTSVKSLNGASNRSLAIVAVDSWDACAFRFPNVDLAGGFPEFDAEEFMAIPIGLAFMPSLTTGVLFDWFEPVRRTAAV